MLVLPNQIAPFVSKVGRILAPWVQYLQQFTQAPPNANALVVTASPFSYTAREPGLIAMNGGNVTSVNIVRGLISIDVFGMKAVQLSINDTAVIQYTVLPTIWFLASYGQNTTQ